MLNDIIIYFEGIPSSIRSIILVSGLAFFLLLESGLPLIRFKYNKLKHAALNIFFTSTTLIINLLGASLILFLANYNATNKTGLLNLIELPIWLNIIIGLMLLDLIGAWLIHWIEHNVKWMWKFHIIHHTDKEVDVTTGLRHHPGESVFRLLFTALAVFGSGASFGIVMLYQTVTAFFAHLTHANITVPKIIDNILKFTQVGGVLDESQRQKIVNYGLNKKPLESNKIMFFNEIGLNELEQTLEKAHFKQSVCKKTVH